VTNKKLFVYKKGIKVNVLVILPGEHVGHRDSQQDQLYYLEYGNKFGTLYFRKRTSKISLLIYQINISRKEICKPTKMSRLLPNQLSSLIKNKIKFSSYIRKFRMEQFQSHLELTASSYCTVYD
jgi:hypothetical protein